MGRVCRSRSTILRGPKNEPNLLLLPQHNRIFSKTILNFNNILVFSLNLPRSFARQAEENCGRHPTGGQEVKLSPSQSQRDLLCRQQPGVKRSWAGRIPRPRRYRHPSKLDGNKRDRIGATPHLVDDAEQRVRYTGSSSSFPATSHNDVMAISKVRLSDADSSSDEVSRLVELIHSLHPSRIKNVFPSIRYLESFPPTTDYKIETQSMDERPRQEFSRDFFLLFF